MSDDLGNPSAFAHTVIDWFVLATGDFLHGAAEVTRDEHNLAFSSAAVARSAGEYASIGWWLADPSLSANDRIARSARVAFESIQKGKKLRSREDRQQYELDTKKLFRWAERNQSGKQRLPDAAHRFEKMNAKYGKRDYAAYSAIAHGDLAITAKLVQEKRGELDSDKAEPLWRLLAACEYSLKLARQVSQLRGREVVLLPGMVERFQELGAEFDAYQL